MSPAILEASPETSLPSRPTPGREIPFFAISPWPELFFFFVSSIQLLYSSKNKKCASRTRHRARPMITRVTRNEIIRWWPPNLRGRMHNCSQSGGWHAWLRGAHDRCSGPVARSATVSPIHFGFVWNFAVKFAVPGMYVYIYIQHRSWNYYCCSLFDL